MANAAAGAPPGVECAEGSATSQSRLGGFVPCGDMSTTERTAVDRRGRRADSRFMHKRVERNAMLGRYGVRYSRGYWAAIVAMFALLVVDIFDDGAIWNYGVIVCILIAIAVRPGGVRGPRAAADEPGPSAAAAADEPAPRAT